MTRPEHHDHHNSAEDGVPWPVLETREYALRLKEFLAKRYVRLVTCLCPDGDPYLRGSEYMDWAGMRFGTGTEYNTIFAVKQFAFALAMSQHPAVRQFEERYYEEARRAQALSWKERLDVEKPDTRFFETEQVLAGLRILDLGCGTCPTFARVCRRLGAEVKTVDVLRPEDFEGYYGPEVHREKTVQQERENHLSLDLRSWDASLKLALSEDRGFHIVTSAHLGTGGYHPKYGGSIYGPEDVYSIVNAVLCPGGIYYDPNQGFSFWDEESEPIYVKLKNGDLV